MTLFCVHGSMLFIKTKERLLFEGFMKCLFDYYKIFSGAVQYELLGFKIKNENIIN